MTSRPVVALIVDNPLRDLDGLTLLAWHLARAGCDVWLAPMYDQAFVIREIRPQVVVTNYLRPNNLEHLREYKRRGAAVMVLDTEGAAGQALSDLARMVIQSGGADLADAYCVWGEGVFRSFLSMKVLEAERVHLVGCPRYDYAAHPWRDALTRPDIQPSFVLVNTNFAGVNPRFSSGQATEQRNSRKIGFSAEFVTQRFIDDQIAMDGMRALVGTLADRFPGHQFVLRPHPFENAQAYAELETRENVQVRQEGTSLDWLNVCGVLVHLGCTTAVEAVMLGVEPVSPVWLETDSNRIPTPSAVSRRAGTVDDLVDEVANALAGRATPLPSGVADAREGMIREYYGEVDGGACARVMRVILDLISGQTAVRQAPRPGLKSRMVMEASLLLGPRLWRQVRQIAVRDIQRRHAGKTIHLAHVSKLVSRLGEITGSSALRVEQGAHRATRSAVRIRA